MNTDAEKYRDAEVEAESAAAELRVETRGEVEIGPDDAVAPLSSLTSLAVPGEASDSGILPRVLLGPQGPRAGWSVLLFLLLLALFTSVAGFVLVQVGLFDPNAPFTAPQAIWSEFGLFLGMLGAAAIVSLIEGRPGNLLDYYLAGPHRTIHFFCGLMAGFVALSVLIGALAAGGWLNFGPVALSGAQIVKFGALWGIAFLLVGCVEEGMFRCFLQATLTRGINFWWALGIVGAVCLELRLRGEGNGIRGVYILALCGLVPCLLLYVNKVEGSNFWQAAWVTSTLFGFVHTGNNGENWIGIFAAAAIGFVFVVSVRVTGSAWWAIGCHGAWDWAETYFYGAADSGNAATGHLLTVSPAGRAFWSGGADGPEGSVLVIAVILLLLGALVLVYGRRKSSALNPASLVEQTAG